MAVYLGIKSFLEDMHVHQWQFFLYSLCFYSSWWRNNPLLIVCLMKTLTSNITRFIFLLWVWHEMHVAGLGIAVLGIGMVIRLIVSFFSVWGTDLNMKERIFIPFAWLPKATVQVRFMKDWCLYLCLNPQNSWHCINLLTQHYFGHATQILTLKKMLSDKLKIFFY